MPRPRKPTQLHVVQGTLNPTRHKDRKGEPVIGEPLGDAPPQWPVPEKIIWAEVANAIPAGVATKADRLIVELTCRLLIDMRAKKLTPALASQLRYCLASLGMTPADRSRVASSVTARLDDPGERFFRDFDA
jgi:hypothetical protein